MILDDHMEALKGILRIDSVNSYPEIEETLIPAAESVIADSVGLEWVEANSTNSTVVQLACTLVAVWFEKPETFGELTPGANSMIHQLQAKAAEA